VALRFLTWINGRARAALACSSQRSRQETSPACKKTVFSLQKAPSRAPDVGGTYVVSEDKKSASGQLQRLTIRRPVDIPADATEASHVVNKPNTFLTP
jgi:hypothetical protein